MRSYRVLFYSGEKMKLKYQTIRSVYILLNSELNG